jgi:hypothetical protein
VKNAMLELALSERVPDVRESTTFAEPLKNIGGIRVSLNESQINHSQLSSRVVPAQARPSENLTIAIPQM